MKLIASLVAVAAAFGVASGAAVAQTKLKWAHAYETSEPFHTQSVWAAEEIKKRTNGKFEITVYPASSLGKESDINQGMQLGTVDMIISGLSFAARSFPRIGVGYYPFTFTDGDHLVKWSKSDAFRELAEGYKKKSGAQVTAVTYYGARHTTSNKPITDCASMKGLKIRVPDAPAYTAMPRACGANPTPIAFAEVYLALENGTVDAQENPLPTIEAKKFFEVQKHIILTGHIIDAVATQVAPHVWNKLSDEEKKIFTEVTQEAAMRGSEQVKQREAELVAEFKKRGLTVSEVDKSGFQKTVLEKIPLESLGYEKSDWEKIQALK
jgi:tripartite ATP-independent transporter DctP family solute receptor